MAKCYYNGLNYPFYTVSAWVWEKDESMEQGGEYCLVGLLDTESYDEAMAKANAVKISADCPEVRVELDDGEEVNWVGTRDEYGWYDT